ncbi:MAG: hypothetical protein IAX21_01370 [Candidatus Bathyarchaeota archaeon]|nr:MAG: hypothetical protein IAX21_01370 [Candidatus Bathyarchaeota archaeon]
MNIEIDVKEIKDMLSVLNKKIDAILENKETCSLMMLTEKSMKEFMMNEPDLYSIKDVKVRYK